MLTDADGITSIDKCLKTYNKIDELDQEASKKAWSQCLIMQPRQVVQPQPPPPSPQPPPPQQPSPLQQPPTNTGTIPAPVVAIAAEETFVDNTNSDGNKKHSNDNMSEEKIRRDDPHENASEQWKKIGLKQTTTNAFSIENITKEITDRINDENNISIKNKTIPVEVGAFIQYYLDLFDVFSFDAKNQLRAGDRSVSAQLLPLYRKHFPPGTLGFTFPRADRSKPPNKHYRVLEGRTIYFVCWEMNIPNLKLIKCFHKNSDGTTCDGDFIHTRWQFRQSLTAMPILDFSGSTDFAIAMQYKCNKCKKTCRATDGKYLHQIPEDLRSAYPVDPKFAINNVQIHLTEACSRMIESLMITHGNGEQLSRMLLEMRGKKHEDLEVQYYNQILRTIRNPSITESDCFPPFDEYFGKDSPSGKTIRSMYQQAKYSSLNRTGISDNMRGTREIQSVGCNLSVSTDYTFAMGKNYQS